jgi:hypothetical protein
MSTTTAFNRNIDAPVGHRGRWSSRFDGARAGSHAQ